MKQQIEVAVANLTEKNSNHIENNIGSLFDRGASGSNQNNNRKKRNEDFVEDLEASLPGVIPTISNQVSNHVAMVNGHVGNGVPRAANGHVANGRLNLRSMLEDAELDSHI